MSSVILKTSPEENLYIVWNTKNDGHEFIGNHAELADYIQWAHPKKYEILDELLERLTETGTSSEDDTFGGWVDTGFVTQSNSYPEDYPATPFRWVNRKNIAKHVQALEQSKWDEAYNLTEPCN